MTFNLKTTTIIIFLVLYSFSGLIPNLGALDRIAPQWFFLSLINSFGLLYLYSDYNNYKQLFGRIIKSPPFLFLSAFILWGLLSYIYALNQTEVLVKFFRWTNILVGLFITSSFLAQLKENFTIISIIFTIVLIIELYYSYSTYFQIISLTEYNFTFANIIKGAAANKNITAASILIKIPFVAYLISRNKNILLRVLLSFLIGLVTYLVFLLSARASIIALFLITITIIIFKVVQYFHNRDLKLLKDSLLYLITPIILSAIFFQAQIDSDNSASLLKRAQTVSTEDTSTQQRLRYYGHSLTQLKNNPIIGVGMGNWKINSIEYDKKDIEGYIIPYHTHNDFLEFGAELGIFGIISYLGLFFYLFYFAIKKNIKEYKKDKFFPESLLLLLGGIIYFIDANLNFPHARVMMQIPFIIYIALYFQIFIRPTSDE